MLLSSSCLITISPLSSPLRNTIVKACTQVANLFGIESITCSFTAIDQLEIRHKFLDVFVTDLTEADQLISVLRFEERARLTGCTVNTTCLDSKCGRLHNITSTFANAISHSTARPGSKSCMGLKASITYNEWTPEAIWIKLQHDKKEIHKAAELVELLNKLFDYNLPIPKTVQDVETIIKKLQPATTGSTDSQVVLPRVFPSPTAVKAGNEVSQTTQTEQSKRTGLTEYTILYLEDDHQTSENFTTFFNTNVTDIESYFEEVYGFKAKLNLVAVSTINDFLCAVASPDNLLQPSEIACHTILLILDLFVPVNPDASPRALFETKIAENISFFDYISKLFVSTPIMLLTSAEPSIVGQKLSQFIHPSLYDVRFKADDGCIDALNMRRAILNLIKFHKPEFENALMSYAKHEGSVSFHTPGHNAGNSFARNPISKRFFESFGETIFSTDLSVSVDSLGDLSEPGRKSPLESARQRASIVFGSEDSFFITGGTSTSNKAMLMALLRQNETIILDRNCHKSVHQAVVVSGASPWYLAPAYNETLGIWAPIDFDQIKQSIEAATESGLQPRMLILTTCSYEGILYPIPQVAELCNRHGILFYADEAWAPYLRFHISYTYLASDRTLASYNAMDGGAHFAVHSTHKALSAFSQASMIHVSKRFKEILEEDHSTRWEWLRERFKSYSEFKHSLYEVLRYWHSTSPNYPMLATLDISTAQMGLYGLRIMDNKLHLADLLRQSCGEYILNKELLPPDGNYENYYHDPLKILVSAKDEAACVTFKNKLSEARIQWEKSTTRTVEFLITAGTFREHIDHLIQIINRNKGLLKSPEIGNRDFNSFLAVGGKLAMLPYKAFSGKTELVTLENSVGKIAAQFVVPYPPGIPVIMPGMLISAGVIDWITKILVNSSYSDVHGVLGGKGDFYIKIACDGS